MPRVTIIGTGLIGASIGLRMKAAAGRGDLEIVGSDSFRDHARAAERAGAVDRLEPNPRRAVQDAALVILATPILAMRELFEEVASALQPGAVVTDTGSTKGDVLEWAEQALPSEVSFIGGHPMAGKTETGPAAADPKLFEGARWVVVPGRRAAGDAVEVVTGLARMMGARPMFMDAREHDAYAAAVSHLPLIAATALFRLTRESEAWPELSALAANGYRDTTRLAGSDPTMAHDIAITNREQIVHWIDRYQQALRTLRAQIADTDTEAQSALFRTLAEANFDYTAFLEGAVGRKEIDETQYEQVPEVAMMDLLLGPAMAERTRELIKRSEERIAESERRARTGDRR